jgi:hypothetical protein
MNIFSLYVYLQVSVNMMWTPEVCVCAPIYQQILSDVFNL